MGYKELITKVQTYSGFSDVESKDALDCMVETLAVRLDDGERKDFASQLPEELQDMALAVLPSDDNTKSDILEQFMESQHIDEPRAKKQMLAAWKALKETIGRGEVESLCAQLPTNAVALLP